MRSVVRVICLFAGCFFFFSAPASSQLGPVHGGGLAPTDLGRIKTGEPAPDFILQNYDGKNVALSDYRGKANVVLVFYRGHF